MMKKDELQKLITETLRGIDLYSDNALNLLLGTCAQESAFGKYRRQLGGGPALGIFQMEPATFRDICDNFLRYKPELIRSVQKVAGVDRFEPGDLVDNDKLAICFARVHYLRLKSTIPSDLSGWAKYWKQHYNTPLGKGTEAEFIEHFKMYVG